MTSLFSQAPTVTAPESGLWIEIRKHLNFYRVHILFFTFTPLVFSGIFYASNGRYKISYIDSLFNCVSAMTVCGLATVNLSSLTGWQQAILFIQMCMGSPVVVSWFMVYIRKYYFARKFQHILEAAAAKKNPAILTKDGKERRPWINRMTALLHPDKRLDVLVEESGSSGKTEKGGIIRKLRPDMIRRMDDAPKLVNPSGWVSEGKAMSIRREPSFQSRGKERRRRPSVASSIQHEPPELRHVKLSNAEDTDTRPRERRLSDPGVPSRATSPVISPIHRYDTVAVGDEPLNSVSKGTRFSRTQTVEFAPRPNVPVRRRWEPLENGMLTPVLEPVQSPERDDPRSIRGQPFTSHVSMNTHATVHTHLSHLSRRSTKHRGFGGFPMPFDIIRELLEKLFPNVKRKLERTMTVPATMSLISICDNPREGGKQVPYISFDAVVGRNSKFHLLTSDQLEEIGGVEYRALNALLWIVAAYHIGIQLVAFTVIAPYISAKKWSDVFVPPQQLRPLRPVWFSIFQVVSSYTNTGMSLVDQSMLPFQHAYPMILFMVFLILAGNTAFPIFLRFMIWILSKIVPKSSRSNETLHFLLDHPRRCFIYLFPSHQTWFLLTIVLGLTFTDWFFFMVLDIGNSVIEDIPLNIRFLLGFLQATAVRAAGFAEVPLASLAPAVKVLYVIMMYISVYPIAMSVRSTNVYEEQSLGVFPDEDDEEEHHFEPSGSRMTVWSRYLAMHARKQLAFDMWWMALALFLVCIIERHHIEDTATSTWFNNFTVIFELVSAYGTVGLSLGIPDQNYSLSGAFHPLSKLIVCLVMIRGRHRGLPVAIDRAVMLPAEFEKEDAARDDMSQADAQNDPDSAFSPGSRYSRNYPEDAPGSDSEQQHRWRRPARQMSNNEMYNLEEAGKRRSREEEGV